MKGNFEVTNEDLLRLQVTLKHHEPFITVGISGTGLNDREFSGHQPTRVFLQEYIYDKDNKEYTPGIRFDKLVQCSPEALDRALKNTEYDVFANGGIDRDAYMRGENVFPVEQFKKEFTEFLNAVSPETRFITNSTSYCTQMLNSIGCGEEWGKLEKRGYVLDQPTLTRAFFKEHGLDTTRCTFEALRDFLNNKSTPERVNGIENRCNLIAKFAEFCGREKGSLVSEQEADYARMSNSYIEDLSRQGHERYVNSSLTGKLEILIKNRKISEQCKDRDFDCDLNKFYDIIDGKSGAKGLIIAHCATTGMSANPPVPIQFSALQLDLDNGKISGISQRLYMDIQADNRSVQVALTKRNDTKSPFDAFKYAGIDYENAYSQGKMTDINGAPMDKPLFSEEKAAKLINRFFDTYKPEEYPIITIGKAKDNTHGFVQGAIAGLGNLPVVEAPSIDACQVLKEYFYVVHSDSKYPKNVLVDEHQDMTSFAFSIRDIAKATHEDIDCSATHTLQRCSLVSKWLSAIAEQHLEMQLNQSKEHQEQEKMIEPARKPIINIPKSEPAAPVQTDAHTEHNEQSRTYREPERITSPATPTFRDKNFEGEYPGKYMTDEEAFIEEGYDNIVDTIAPAPKTDFSEVERDDDDIEAEVFRRNIDGNFIEREVFSRQMPSKEAEHVENQPAHTVRHIEMNSVRPEAGNEKHELKVDNTTAKEEQRTSPASPTVTTPEVPAQQAVSPDIAALVSAMNAQTNAMSAQMNAVNTQMMALVQQNTTLINAVVLQSQALTATLESTIELLASNERDGAEKDPMMQQKTEDKGKNTIEKLEEIKEQISGIFKGLQNSPAKELLINANEYISKGQTAIDKVEEQHRQSPGKN